MGRQRSLLEQVIDAARFPIASRVGSAAGEEYEAPSFPDASFAFGLERVLDGIEVLVNRGSRQPGSRQPGSRQPEESE